ncbi:MAG: outer membrane protein assembly factor BamD [Deltaproteobacteria bacterium]|nr:outer membrane protein assembly factor BamD [Deltaproteobacteria bacterium]
MRQDYGKNLACRRFLAPARFFLIFLLLSGLSLACASRRTTIAGNAQSLYHEAEKAFQKKSYSRALELFQNLQNDFPDTEEARLALLRTADISYCRKELEDAARTYNDFINFNADHSRAPYAFYQVGMSHYVTLKTIDLDLEALRRALETFQEALSRYPDHPPYTAKIIQRINDCKRRFAKREFYVGFYYYKNGKFHSAVKRFESLLQNYPGYIDDKVLYYLGLANLNRGELEAGQRALLTLTRAFPESPYTAEARSRLEEGKGPGLPLLFMARDYFIVHDLDIGDAYLTTAFAPENYSPRFFSLLRGPRPVAEAQAEEVTFASLYQPRSFARSAGEEVLPGAAKVSDPSLASQSSSPEGAVPDLRPQTQLGTRDEPLEIISDWTEADRQQGIITFGGKVIAKQKDMVLYADKVINYFDMQTRKLIRAVAVGDVKLNQADKFVTCERAELNQAERKVTLTGNPVMWQGENRVSGERVVVYLDQSQAEVFSGKEGKAKVRIEPRK